MKSKKVSIIIPVLNRKSRLIKVLDALNKQSYQGEYEIIVVDNGSEDGTFESAQKHADIVIRETTYKTPYVCRNKGLEVASGDVFILLDVNCLPQQYFIEQSLKCLGDEPKIIKGKLLPENLTEADAFVRFDYINSDPREYETKKPTALPGGVLAFPRAVWEVNGSFIPYLRSLADIEWTGRAYLAGIRLELCPKMTVFYPFKARKAMLKKGRRTGGGVKARWLREHNGFGFKWPFFVVKHFFPPSPTFTRFLMNRNKMDDAKLTTTQIIFIAWLYKIHIGLGLLFTSSSLKR